MGYSGDIPQLVTFRRMRPAFLIIGLCAALLGCASIQNAPVNQPGSSAGLAGKVHLNFEEQGPDEDDLIGLSFSGGGTRAAAFSFGVLTEMEHTPVRGAQRLDARSASTSSPAYRAAR